MKITILSVLLLGALATAPAPAFAAGSSAPSKAAIAQQFTIWNAALQTGDPAKVAALYCEPGGVLLPTVSNTVRTNRAAITDYFVHFLQLKPKGSIDQSYIHILGPDTAINSGIYTFDVTENGKPAQVQARFTFVYQKVNGTWCIMDHHSSAMPEKAPSAASH
ncbi:MAG TPA: SgcJ/EcaC family oxidoreductase [Gammaproteobacteria bacterium]|nr:SgcJ/EcaC family oxidoreductase [Gammaproteobacteria bacterium]